MSAMLRARVLVVSQESTRTSLLRAQRQGLAALGVELSVFDAEALSQRPEQVADAARLADVVLLSHLLRDDLAQTATELLRDSTLPSASIFVLQSLKPLLLQTRIGGRSVGELVGAMPMLERLLRADDLTRDLKGLIQRLPLVLAAIPEQRLDARSYLEAMLYWREPSPKNLGNLVCMLASRWGPARADELEFDPPQLHPEQGLWHPRRGVLTKLEDYGLPKWAQHHSAHQGAASLAQSDIAQDHAARSPAAVCGRVGLLLMRGSVIAGDTHAAQRLIDRLEQRGIECLAAFAESFDHRAAIEEYFDPAGVDAIVSLTGFPLVGGHNAHVGDETRAFLAARDALYLTPAQLMLQSEAAWRRSRLGLTPLEVAMQLAIHESEGGIEPLVVQTIGAEGSKELLEERAERVAGRIAAWLRLRRLANHEKRVALTLFRFPPDKGAVGTAAYLDVFRSTFAILERLAAEGYDVEMPSSADELLQRVIEGDGDRLASAATIDAREYERLVPEWTEQRRLWGDPPGAIDSDGRELRIHGIRLGKVFVGVQPSFGFEGDPMRLLFETSATPHFAFAAYYRWLSQVFAADAIVHAGTHGAHEFMPGKQTGLSQACWPDKLLGDVPNLYLYAINNPAEATIAKRRGYALTIGHLTPPCERAGLYGGLEELRALLADWLREDEGQRQKRTLEVVRARVEALHLDRELDDRAINADTTDAKYVSALSSALDEIEARRIPVGLHVIGAHRDAGDMEGMRDELLSAIAEHGDSLVRILLEGRGHDPEGIESGVRAGNRDAIEVYRLARERSRELVRSLDDRGAALAVAQTFSPGLDEDRFVEAADTLENVRAALDRCDELSSLVRALGGKHVAAGPGGDPVKAPDVLPSGRNVHALDPGRVPSAAALAHAQRSVDLMLERRRRDLGAWPQHVGFVLWGLDNVKTQGEAIAQAFLLLGTRPIKNSIGRISEVEVIPLEELGRPRIDVTISASGIFRDLFGAQLELLDRAVRIVADLDESPNENFVRARVERIARDFGGDRERAASRVFSNEAGEYGAHVDHLIGLSAWEERSEIASTWLSRKGFAFGSQRQGVADPELLRKLAADIDTTYQSVDSAEVSLIDVDHYFEYLGGFQALVENERGERPQALIADASSFDHRDSQSRGDAYGSRLAASCSTPAGIAAC